MSEMVVASRLTVGYSDYNLIDEAIFEIVFAPPLILLASGDYDDGGIRLHVELYKNPGDNDFVVRYTVYAEKYMFFYIDKVGWCSLLMDPATRPLLGEAGLLEIGLEQGRWLSGIVEDAAKSGDIPDWLRVYETHKLSES